MKTTASLPDSCSVAAQTGYMLLAIGNLLNSLPDLKSSDHLGTGDLLIKIGRKLATTCNE